MQLYFVVGAVAAKSAMIEDAAWSVSRALDGDFSFPVGQQTVPPLTYNCVNRNLRISRCSLKLSRFRYSPGFGGSCQGRMRPTVSTRQVKTGDGFG